MLHGDAARVPRGMAKGPTAAGAAPEGAFPSSASLPPAPSPRVVKESPGGVWGATIVGLTLKTESLSGHCTSRPPF